MLLLLLLESNQNKPGKLISVLCCIKSLLHHFLETEQALMKDREITQIVPVGNNVNIKVLLWPMGSTSLVSCCNLITLSQRRTWYPLDHSVTKYTHDARKTRNRTHSLFLSTCLTPWSNRRPITLIHTSSAVERLG